MQQAERDWPQAVAEQAVQVNKDQTDMKGALRLLASWLQQRRNLALPVVPVADGALGSADESAAGDAEAQAELVPQREQNIAQQVGRALMPLFCGDVAPGQPAVHWVLNGRPPTVQWCRGEDAPMTGGAYAASRGLRECFG